MAKRNTTSRATDILDRRIGNDEQLRDMVAQETIHVRVAQLIHDARQEAGLTQQQLGDLVGTTQPVIARLENADYRGHSLSMLQRIAGALDQKLEINFAPQSPRRRIA